MITQRRLDALAAYAKALRKAHPGNDEIGEICDQIERLAWGPIRYPKHSERKTNEKDIPR